MRASPRFERNELQLRARVPRAGRRRGGGVRLGCAHRSPRTVADRRVRHRHLPDRCLTQLATRDDRVQAAPARPPAPKRPHRRHCAAARPARPHAGDARLAGRARGPPAARPLCPAGVARGVVRHAHRRVLRLRPAERVGAQHRARVAHPRRLPLLVAARVGKAVAAARTRISRGWLRRLIVPRARAHLLEPAVLLVLRAHAAPLGTLTGARPEPRRHPDERRADARLPARDRVVRVAAARRRGRQRGRSADAVMRTMRGRSVRESNVTSK